MARAYDLELELRRRRPACGDASASLATFPSSICTASFRSPCSGTTCIRTCSTSEAANTDQSRTKRKFRCTGRATTKRSQSRRPCGESGRSNTPTTSAASTGSTLQWSRKRSPGRPQIECLDGAGADFAIGDANGRLAEEFRRARVAEGPPVSPESQLVADLTLVLLFLGSWEEGKGARAAYKTMRFETLDALADAGLVVTNTHRKSVDLTDEGVKRAEALLQRVVEILRP